MLPLVIASVAPAAIAQREIPKAPGHEQCPLGYVNTLGTTCVSPIYYEVAPTYGKACKSGWMNIGAGSTTGWNSSKQLPLKQESRHKNKVCKKM